MAPFPSDKRGSQRRECDSLVGGWRLVEGEGAGTGRSEAHQSPLVPASVLEADVAPTPPPSALPAPALEASGRSGTALLTPSLRCPAGCRDIWMPICSSLCGAASFGFATRQTRRTPRIAGKPPETRGGAWDTVSFTALGAPPSSSLQNTETKHVCSSQRPSVWYRRRQPCGG